MKITKVTKSYFETEGERVYFFEPLDEEMTIIELQELMDENEKFLLNKGIAGEFYPCKPDIFEKTYQCIENDNGVKNEE